MKGKIHMESDPYGPSEWTINGLSIEENSLKILNEIHPHTSVIGMEVEYFIMYCETDIDDDEIVTTWYPPGHPHIKVVMKRDDYMDKFAVIKLPI
jgi:hypothetical protein